MENPESRPAMTIRRVEAVVPAQPGPLVVEGWAASVGRIRRVGDRLLDGENGSWLTFRERATPISRLEREFRCRL